jgi:hypothetical protein
VFYQKLQLAGESGNYLIVPFNLGFHQLYLRDYEKLYEIFVSTTLDAVRAARLDVIPIIEVLRQWFLSLLTIPTFPPFILPPSKSADPPWASAVISIGRNLHRFWNRKDKTWTQTSPSRTELREDDNFRRFIAAVVSFPNGLASAFGFKSAIIVCDHVDIAGFGFEPKEPFPVCRREVNLFGLIWDAIRSFPFFISSHSDEALLELFSEFGVDDYSRVTTIDVVDGPVSHVLLVSQKEIVLEPGMCRGCPGYCVAFERVCKLAQDATQYAAVKTKYTQLTSVVDVARNDMIRQDFLRLAALLAAIDTDQRFNEEAMNTITDDDQFTVVVK